MSTDEKQEQPKSYKVTLNTGDYGIFTNYNDFEDYPSRLVSGIYSIHPRSGRDSIRVLPSTVISIEELEIQEENLQ